MAVMSMMNEELLDFLQSELVGLKEVAEILGWDRRRVATYQNRGTFPVPVAKLAMGPIWLRRQITEYKSQKEGPAK